MNDKDEDFLSEFFAESGTASVHSLSDMSAQDTVDKQVILAVRELYRVDEADNRSVQRAWEQIVQMGLPEQQSTVPLKIPGVFSQAAVPQTRKKTRRWRSNALAACIIALVLVGSMTSLLLVLAQKNGQQGVATHTPSPQGTQPLPPLGTHLERVALGMSSMDFLDLLKPDPDLFKGSFHKMLAFQSSTHGVMALFDSLTKAVQIVSWTPEMGTTAEGFTIGMSFNQFIQIYKQFTIVTIDAFNQQSTLFVKQPVFVALVTDRYNTALWAVFDKDQKAIELVIQANYVKDATNG